MKKVVLASTSPRRKQLLSKIIDKFEIRAPFCEEIEYGLPQNIALKNAENKARCILNKSDSQNDIIIACDTVVTKDNVIYGKPCDKEDAIKIIKELKGSWHSVISGVFVIADKEYSYYAQSKVLINDLTDAQIEEYIEKFAPYDKAGSYGIQDSMIVKEYTGDYNNIVGMPLNELRKILRENGIDVKE